jgi:molecular chaperone IbpA
MNQFTRLDTTALNRAMIGFDRMFDDVSKKFANSAQTNYPPYNIIKTGENDYAIEIAVTGFSKDEILVKVEQEQLVISAVSTKEQPTESEYLYRGLAARDFTRGFSLADHVEVVDAIIADGLLTVTLKRVLPEALKPRTITINDK